jgi:hypothetical protein
MTIYRRWPNKGAVVMDAFPLSVAQRRSSPRQAAPSRAYSCGCAPPKQIWKDDPLAGRRRSVRPRRSGSISAAMDIATKTTGKEYDRARDATLRPSTRSGRGHGHRHAICPIYDRLLFEKGPISHGYADGLYDSVLGGYGTSRHPVDAKRTGK